MSIFDIVITGFFILLVITLIFTVTIVVAFTYGYARELKAQKDFKKRQERNKKMI